MHDEIPTGYGIDNKVHKELVATFGQEFTWDMSNKDEREKWIEQLPKSKKKKKRK
jgi:hypothetical protein